MCCIFVTVVGGYISGRRRDLRRTPTYPFPFNELKLRFLQTSSFICIDLLRENHADSVWRRKKMLPSVFLTGVNPIFLLYHQECNTGHLYNAS
jgi:hypothetical protein